MNERGSSLLLTTVLLLIGMIVLAGLFALASSDYRSALAIVEVNKARYIAEAGITKAITKLNRNPKWREGFPFSSFGEGSYTVTIVNEQESHAERAQAELPELVVIRSDAFVPPRAKRSLQVIYNVKEKKIISWSE
ncbi:hypothetical protein [Effusibacillus consociatus]|uniref:Type 4 fimbrial biogenesis protein PilX N-terminal domain-containing protein n=1 Tax=Effusibacillus consociatus TaxID=1117041 RepID=A0ABV9Q5P9_9BACL